MSKILKILFLFFSVLSFSISASAKINAKQWELTCAKENKKNCVIAIQIIQDNNNNKKIFSRAFIEYVEKSSSSMNLVNKEAQTYKLEEKKTRVPFFSLGLPLNTDLQTLPTVSINGKSLLFNLKFIYCNQNEGCKAAAYINDSIIQKFEANNEFFINFKTSGRKELLQIKYPLKNFTKSHAGLL